MRREHCKGDRSLQLWRLPSNGLPTWPQAGSGPDGIRTLAHTRTPRCWIGPSIGCSISGTGGACNWRGRSAQSDEHGQGHRYRAGVEGTGGVFSCCARGEAGEGARGESQADLEALRPAARTRFSNLFSAEIRPVRLPHHRFNGALPPPRPPPPDRPSPAAGETIPKPAHSTDKPARDRSAALHRAETHAPRSLRARYT